MRFLLSFLYVLFFSPLVFADALVINKAMQSPTIAQYYVNDKGVHLDLEVSEKNMQKFSELYPNSLRRLLALEESPLKQRAKKFLGTKLSVIADNQTLPGFIQSLRSGKKIQRDPITGEELPVQSDEAPSVLYISIEYPFISMQPKKLDLIADLKTKIGFVLYHEDQAVNDFRFLSPKQSVQLDWEDPFYSAFTVQTLLRQYRFPISFFLYVEPYEVRKEFVLRPKDLEAWIDLGIKDKKVLTLKDQEIIKTKVSNFLMKRAKTTIDGKELPAKLDRVHFIERTLKRSGVITPPRELLSSTATLGVIYTYAVHSLPNKVEVDWDLFNEKINYVPATTTDEVGPYHHYLEPDVPTLTWNNYIRFPKDRSIKSVNVLQTVVDLPWLSLLLLLIVLSLFLLYRKKQSKKGIVIMGLLSLLAMGSWPYVKIQVTLPMQAGLDEKEAKPLLNALLSNVYHSFVFKEESAIYDALEKNVHGDLLSDIYLQVKQSLKLKNQGGAEASVDNVGIQSLKLNAKDEGYTLDTTWDVNGSVGHWGHIHQRANRYSAEFFISAIDGVWKIEKMKVYSEERLK